MSNALLKAGGCCQGRAVRYRLCAGCAAAGVVHIAMVEGLRCTSSDSTQVHVVCQRVDLPRGVQGTGTFTALCSGRQGETLYNPRVVYSALFWGTRKNYLYATCCPSYWDILQRSVRGYKGKLAINHVLSEGHLQRSAHFLCVYFG